jgi:hypothetical protein
MRLRLFVIVLVAVLLAACQEKEGEPQGEGAGSGATGRTGSGADSGGLGDLCDDETPCGQDLYCAMGGDLAGTCTAECTASSVCKARYGDKAMCSGGLCYLTCAVSRVPPPIPNAPPQQLANYFECPTERCDVVSDYGLCVSTL